MTTARTIHDAFLADIVAHPDDDAPRLIYADWLEEHGEGERAEFIRVQCSLPSAERTNEEKMDSPECYCWQKEPGFHCLPCLDKMRRLEALRRREKELLGVVTGRECLRWVDAGLSAEKWQFRRGFIASIAIPSATFMQHAADIIEAVPMLEEVRLTDKNPTFYAQRDGGSWHKINEEDGYENHYLLPSVLFDRLKDGFLDESEEIMDYERQADAHNDLAAACLAFAREQLLERQKQQERERLILSGNPQALAPQGIINRPYKKR